MKIELMKVSDLIEYENNAKEHPQEQIDQIAASIEEFGNNDPIAIDENNVIIEGHGRLMALKQLGYEEIPVIRLEHLTEEQKQAYILTHNKLTMNTGFNPDILLEELSDMDKDLKNLTGFTDEEISKIMDEKNFKERELNRVDLTNVESISEIGDIWILDGRHKIICGDSTDMETYDELFSDGSMIDMVLTDPPYNIGYVESSYSLNEQYQRGSTIIQHKNIENDKMEEDFGKFISDYYLAVDKYLKAGGPLYIFFSQSDLTPVIEFEKIFHRSMNMVWNKEHANMARTDYNIMDESIVYGWKTGAKHKWYGDYNLKSIIDPLVSPLNDLEKKTKDELLKVIRDIIDNDKIENSVFFHYKPRSNSLHPTMKPVKLLKRLLRNSSIVDDIIFDGFLGSGSTLIAAEELKRKLYGIELYEAYVDTSVIRYINYKNDNEEDYDIKLLRNGEIIELEDTGLLDLIKNTED